MNTVKFLISTFCLVAISLIMLSTNEVKADDSVHTFSELVHHSCNASSGMGGTCSATCTDACSCSCSSGFFSCTCSCTCPEGGDETQIETIQIAPKERWDILKEIINEENTDISAQINKQLIELYELGIKEKVEEFNTLAEQVDKDLMKLQPSTIQKLLISFAG